MDGDEKAGDEGDATLEGRPQAEQSNMVETKKLPATEKINVLAGSARGSGGKQSKSSFPPPKPTQPESHTSIVLDRVLQWVPVKT